MLSVCWSPKGGSGVSVVAAALGLGAAEADRSTLLVDLAGDLAAVLAVEAPGAGVAEWVASSDAPPEALTALAVEVVPGLRLLPPGADVIPRDHPRLPLLLELAALDADRVIVDAGVVTGEPWWPHGARSVVVVRACYLAVRRLAGRSDHAGASIVLIEEPGRALTRHDVAAAVGGPVTTLAWDPAVARAVDAGLLARRLPRSLRGLRDLDRRGGGGG